MKKSKIHVGAKFGDIEILEVIPAKYSHTICVCKCHNCGKLVEMPAYLVRNPTFKGHCGCKPHRNSNKSSKNANRTDANRASAILSIKKFILGIKTGETNCNLYAEDHND